MRIFITGGTGFAGSHLADTLLARGEEIFGLVHEGSSHQPYPNHPNFKPIPGDLTDGQELKRVITDIRPDVIYHLAGQPSPTQAWVIPAETININVGGTVHLLEAARASGSPRVIVITSAQIYGRIDKEDLPITENTIPEPDNPYGLSKWAAGQLCGLYWQRYKLPVMEARPFNHIGPRQALGFVVPDFASQIAAVKLGLQTNQVSVGNLTARRDFTDVRDVAKAYLDIADEGRPGETYLICSGQAVSIKEILEILIDLAGIDIEIVQAENRRRSSEESVLYGGFAKLQKDTGWQPTIPLRKSLSDALQDWLNKLSA